MRAALAANLIMSKELLSSDVHLGHARYRVGVYCAVRGELAHI